MKNFVMCFTAMLSGHSPSMGQTFSAQRRRSLQIAFPSVHGIGRVHHHNTYNIEKTLERMTKQMDVPSLLNLFYFHCLKFFPHSFSKGTQQFNDFLKKTNTSIRFLTTGYLATRTLTTSTGSFFMLFGQVSSGLFSGSPGRSKILRRFLTSSIRSLAALESSRRSLRTMGGRGCLAGDRGIISFRDLVLLPSVEDRDDSELEVDDGTV